MNETLKMVEELVNEWRKTPEVLIIDDDIIYTTVFRNCLEKCGCSVEVALNSTEAASLVEDRSQVQKPYDIIFLDLVIPSTDGPAILKVIREKMHKVPVVIVTGYPDSHKVQEALQYGYLGLVKKPLNLEEIEMIFDSHKILLPHIQETPNES